MNRLLVTTLAVGALALTGCSTDTAARDDKLTSGDAAAQSDVRHAVPVIERCYADGDNEYPTAVRAATGTVTLLCGSVSETIHLSGRDALTYTPRGSEFTIEVAAAGGHTYSYDSSTGKVTKR